MKSFNLRVDLTALQNAVDLMGASSISVEPILVEGAGVWKPPTWKDIDGVLLEGKEVRLEDVEHPNALLEVEGRQVVLFIADHGWRVRDALEDGEKGRRIHVAWCTTLRDMKVKGRYERYVVTTRTGPRFPISGEDENGTSVEGEARLMVCQNCLRFLRYKGYTGGKNAIWRGFTLEEFFETYSTFFPRMPRRWAGSPEGYSDDWRSRVSPTYRSSRSWTCEECRVNLDDARDLLHVHHRDGVKSNNVWSNLKAVCLLCHAREPDHSQIRVGPMDYKKIQRRRRAQGLLDGLGWGDVARLVNPGVTGAVHRLAAAGAVPAELGWGVTDGGGRLVAEPELAWPKSKVGVAIARSDRKGMRGAEWAALKVHEPMAPDKGVLAELKRRSRPRPRASPPSWSDHNLPW